MDIRTEYPKPDAAVITLDGEMDLYNANKVRTAFQQALTSDCRGLVLELSKLRYLDSSGVGVLIHLMQSLKTQGGRLAIVGLHGPPEKVLDMTHILDLIRTFPNISAALDYVRE